jgi:hypothetical protein
VYKANKVVIDLLWWDESWIRGIRVSIKHPTDLSVPKIFNLATPTSPALKMDPDATATHEEIWDDSALVESWNQALEEYKVGGRARDSCMPPSQSLG